MFTFCFTSVAAALIRRAQNRTKARNQAARSVRLVRQGLAGLVLVLVVSGVANAGGKSMGGGMSGGGGGAMFSSQRSQSTPSSQFNSNSMTSNKLDFHKPTVLGNQTTLSSGNTGIVNAVKIDKTRTLVGTDKQTWTPKLDTKDLKNVKINDGIKLGDLNVKATDKGIKLGDLNGIKSDKDVVSKGLNGLKIKGIDTKFNKDDFKKFCHDKKWFNNFCYDECFHDCYHCCPWWYCWEYPVWCPLYHHCCGYWYDVPVVEIVEGVDLQLLAVRMIDSGNPEANLGPAFRVWIRNNSHLTIAHPFNVLALAARDNRPTADLPQAGVRIDAIEAGQVLPIDIRLPVEANQPSLPMLHVLVDSHREIAEVFEDNNGAILNRADILPIDAVAGTAVAPPTNVNRAETLPAESALSALSALAAPNNAQ